MPSLALALAAVIACGCGRLGFGSIGAVEDGGPGDRDVGADAVLPEGLVAWYRMDEIATFAEVGRALDASGRDHHAACVSGDTCPAVVPGRSGVGAFQFGPDTELRVATTADLQTTLAFTIVVWLRFDASSADDECAVQKLFGAVSANSWQLCLQPNRTVLFYSTDGSLTDSLFSPTPLAPGAWHRIALRWDGTAKAIVIAGEVVAERTMPIVFDASDILIGRDIDEGIPSLPFQGALDDLRIYDRALSLPELVMLAQ